MKLPFRTLLIAALLAGAGEAFSVSQQEGEPLTDRELEEMMEDLDKIRQRVRARQSGRFRAAIKDYQSAAASDVKAYQYYLKCMKEARFERQGKMERAWKAWKDQNDSWIGEKEHMQARRMQLRYLILTAKAGLAENIEEIRQLVVPLTDFMKDLVKLSADTHKHLSKPVSASVFAEVYGIEDAFEAMSWESNPINFDGIFEKTILPLYRADRDPALVSAWRTRIQLTTALMEKRKEAYHKDLRDKLKEARRKDRLDRVDPRRTAEANNEVRDFEEFEQEGLPELKWDMALDFHEHGFETAALNGMLAVIREHTAHPRISTWMAHLGKLLKDDLGLPVEDDGEDETAGQAG